MKDQQRIAFFGVGMVATGPQERGIPTLLLLFDRLARKYDLVVYRINPGGKLSPETNYVLRSTPTFGLPTRLRYLIICFQFIIDHLIKPFEVIHALSPSPAGRLAMWCGKLWRIPVIIHLHSAEGVSFPEFRHGDLLASRRKALHLRVCNGAAAVTVLSQSQQDLVMRHLAPVQLPRVIPRGLDCSAFRFQEKTSPILRLLYVGYPEEVKDPAGAIAVFGILSEHIKTTLCMVGDGLTADVFQEALSHLPQRHLVTFAGSVPHEKMNGFYHEADILLVTSRYESQSAVALEAMASGVLVCGTHVGILSDLSGSACTTVAPASPEALAEATALLWKDQSRQQAQRQHARRWVEAHDADWTMAQYEKLMREISRLQK